MGVSDPMEQRLISQIVHVKLVQKRLEYVLQWLKTDGGEWFQQRAADLVRECRAQVLLVQVTGRTHEKIRIYRENLLRDARAGKNVQKLQERLFQLESDLDCILSCGRKFKSPSSKLVSEEESVTGSSTRPSTALSEQLPWKSPERSVQKQEERKSFLSQFQEVGAQIEVDEVPSKYALQDHRLSSHQNPRQVYPADPSVWRRSSLDFTHIQPWFFVQPVLLNNIPGSFYTMNHAKGKWPKPRMDQYSPLLHRIPFISDQQSKIIDPQTEPMKWKRIKEVSQRLITASREHDQVEAAKALGHFGCVNDFVLSALHQTLQVSQTPTVRFEIVKALTLLECLDTDIVKEVMDYLTSGSEELIRSILIALKSTLEKWFLEGKPQDSSPEDEPGLTNALIQLLTTRDHLDVISLEAAICLAYLATSHEVAVSTLLSCLCHIDMKTRMQALSALVMCLRVHNAVTIQAALDQISKSKVHKHRIEASSLLCFIGLQKIRQEGLEGKVFDLLREKLYDDPVQAVRQAVGRAVESLQMKKLMYEVVEKQLEEQSEVSRMQAVMSLGILGFHSQHILDLLMEMLDMDKSKEVRIQIIRLICSLRLKDPLILRKLKLKEQGEGPLAREAAKALHSLRKIARTKGC